MLYIIGSGLNEKSLSLESIVNINKCHKIYFDGYTSAIPYNIHKLEKTINKKVTVLNRETVESEKLTEEAKKENVCLLVYGSPLFATTHFSLVDECKKKKIKVDLIYNTSVFDAIAETGLQLYKFGKICSIPKWQDNFKPSSFLDVVKENLSINSHSLILIDIGLDFKTAISLLLESSKEKNIEIDKMVVCSRLGTSKKKIFYGNPKTIKKVKGVKEPFCFIIPSSLHFFEEKIVNEFKI